MARGAVFGRNFPVVSTFALPQKSTSSGHNERLKAAPEDSSSANSAIQVVYSFDNRRNR